MAHEAGHVQMGSHRAFELRVLFPSGRPRALRASHGSDPGRTQAHRRTDRLDQHRPFVDACRDDGHRRIHGRQAFAQVANHRFADSMVAHDGRNGVCRWFRRGAVLPLHRHRSRRKLLCAQRLCAHRNAPQGNAFARAFDPSGRALRGPHGFRAGCRLGSCVSRIVAQRVRRFRFGRRASGHRFHLGAEGRGEGE